MIEKFYKDRHVLRDLRSGATGPHIQAYATTLVEEGYSVGGGRNQLRGAARLGHWLEANGIPLESLDEDVLDTFFACNGSNRPPGRRRNGKPIPRFEGSRKFLRWARAHEVVTTTDPEAELPPLIHGFEEWMLRNRSTSMDSLVCYGLQLRRFLDAVGDDPSRFDAAGIRSFILGQSQRTGPSRTKQAVTAVRMFLRYLSVIGRCAPELVGAVPTIAYWKLATLPRYVSNEDVDRIIDSCDPATVSGRRNRSMLLLMARLGLRAGDVAAIQLGDIDWIHATITVSGKGRRAARLPLPQDVGDAILAWLTDGRPDCPDEHVFLRLRAPVGPVDAATISMVAAQAVERSGVEALRAGSHLLRHSAATAWLNEGMSLPAIGALLRHRSLETTAIYAKVDVGLLRTVARPWPVEVRS